VKKIHIKGPIISNNDQWIYDLFDIEATSPKLVDDQLADANGSEVEVIINSGGGSVFAGSEIYTSLKDYAGTVTNKVVGLAASAASVIAMAGDKLLMSPTSQMMVHNASVVTAGDYRDMDHMSTVLKNVNQTVANAYKLKSGMSDEDLLKMMDDETWLTPQQALENNFIDEIMFESNEPKLVASVNDQGMLPDEVINKIRNMKETFNPVQSEEQPTDNESDILNAKLSLLKLRKVDDE